MKIHVKKYAHNNEILNICRCLHTMKPLNCWIWNMYVDFGGVSWVAQEHFYGDDFVLRGSCHSCHHLKLIQNLYSGLSYYLNICKVNWVAQEWFLGGNKHVRQCQATQQAPWSISLSSYNMEVWKKVLLFVWSQKLVNLKGLFTNFFLAAPSYLD